MCTILATNVCHLKYSLLSILYFSILNTLLPLTAFGKYCIQNTFPKYFLIYIICVVCVHYIKFVQLSCAIENSVEDFAFLLFSAAVMT